MRKLLAAVGIVALTVSACGTTTSHDAQSGSPTAGAATTSTAPSAPGAPGRSAGQVASNLGAVIPASVLSAGLGMDGSSGPLTENASKTPFNPLTQNEYSSRDLSDLYVSNGTNSAAITVDPL
jgi:hypothetical protein